MTLEPGDLLERLAATLRADIGPAIADEYTRTQAFMASVILAKAAKQVRLGPAHAEAEQADVRALHDALPQHLSDAPEPVIAAVAQAESQGSIDALGPVIETIYQWGTNDPQASAALALIRATLRKDIDRRMEIAK